VATVQAEDWQAQEDAALLVFLLEGFRKRLRTERPGTDALIEECVAAHLRERLRLRRETRP
jgi:hypothetical protein